MTDKEKRELKDGVISIFKNFNLLDHTATIGGLRDNILRYIDSLQEEPVSEKKCMFTKDIYTDEDRKILCEDCEEKCEYSKKEEPVSEDLEEEIKDFFEERETWDSESQPSKEDIARHFVDWQKQKDRKWLADNHKQIFNNGWSEGYEVGRDSMEEDIMKDAVDGVIADRWADQKLSIDMQPVDTYSYNLYDKVKVIIVKQEEE